MLDKTSGSQVKSFLLPLLIACLALWTASHVKSQEQPSKVTIEKVPAQATPEVSGAKLFQTYCAVCHGTNGKGNGPAALALKTPPPDLTLLAKNNGGNFPGKRVVLELTDPTQAPHGNKDMPIWGDVFRSMGSSAIATMRETNLTNYLKSIQAK